MEFSKGQTGKAGVIAIKSSDIATRAPGNRNHQAQIREILGGTGMQAKLTVGAPNDRHEQEADSVADQVMRMTDADLQRQADAPEEENEEEA